MTAGRILRSVGRSVGRTDGRLDSGTHLLIALRGRPARLRCGGGCLMPGPLAAMSILSHAGKDGNVRLSRIISTDSDFASLFIRSGFCASFSFCFMRRKTRSLFYLSFVSSVLPRRRHFVARRCERINLSFPKRWLAIETTVSRRRPRRRTEAVGCQEVSVSPFFPPSSTTLPPPRKAAMHLPCVVPSFLPSFPGKDIAACLCYSSSFSFFLSRSPDRLSNKNPAITVLLPSSLFFLPLIAGCQ